MKYKYRATLSLATSRDPEPGQKSDTEISSALEPLGLDIILVGRSQTLTLSSPHQLSSVEATVLRAALAASLNNSTPGYSWQCESLVLIDTDADDDDGGELSAVER